MDHIDERFATDAVNPKFHAAICASLGLPKNTLNQYYDLTDWSEVYHIAMGEFLLEFTMLLCLILVSHSATPQTQA
jgi:hypothetical protein